MANRDHVFTLGVATCHPERTRRILHSKFVAQMLDNVINGLCVRSLAPFGMTGAFLWRAVSMSPR